MGAEEVVDDGTDVGPVAGIAWRELHGCIDSGDTCGGEGDAVDGVLVGDATEDSHFIGDGS